MRRGSGQGGRVCRREAARWERAVQLEQRDVGGGLLPCEGRDGDAGALTQVCCVPESRRGQVPVKVSAPRLGDATCWCWLLGCTKLAAE